MKFQHLFAAASLATLSVLPAQADLTLAPAGMKIVWASLSDEFDGFSTYNSKEGVYVTVGVKSDDKSIISFDKDKSKASILYGDQNLGGGFGFWNKTSKDGKTMRIEVSSDKLPQGANKDLKLSGQLIFTTASETNTKISGPRELKKGDKLTFSDDFKCEVSEIGKPKNGKHAMEVSLKWKRDIPELAAIRFYDEAGKLIESKPGGWSSMGGFGRKTVTKSYQLEKASAILKIEVDLWSDHETLTVPLDLTLGMQGGQ
ncbi:hypothetical protein JIN77_03315 [Verrucomicrobiaceae bacterium R5-34]|nr:hypothetical protein [Verrucomicrobiaceae bacterium R5-34]